MIYNVQGLNAAQLEEQHILDLLATQIPHHPNVLRPICSFVAPVSEIMQLPQWDREVLTGDAALCVVMEQLDMPLAQLITQRRYGCMWEGVWRVSSPSAHLREYK